MKPKQPQDWFNCPFCGGPAAWVISRRYRKADSGTVWDKNTGEIKDRGGHCKESK